MLVRVRNFRLLRHQSTKALQVKQLTKNYGMLAFGLYSSLSFSTFCLCFYSVSYAGLTQADIYEAFNKVRSFVGMESKVVDTELVYEESWLVRKLPSFLKTDETSRIITNLLIALGLNKLFIPLKLTITALLVPSLARKLRLLGWIGKVNKS